ncbi:putative signaling protein [Burkholderiaceae bacterium]|nr:putative signaling protein [Burkholderiaceae bacterium]
MARPGTPHTRPHTPAQDDAAPSADTDLTAIFDNAFVGICFVREQRIARCNQHAADIFGRARSEDLVGEPASALYHDAASYERLNREAAPLLAAGKPYVGEWELRRGDGSPVWCKVYGNALTPAHPERGTVWVIEDITDAKAAAQALQHSKAVLDDTLEYMDQGISIVDSDLRALVVNRRFCELLGFPESMGRPGTPFADYIRYNALRGDYGPGDVEEQVRTRVELARRFEPHRFERERPDGTVLEIRGMPIPGRGFVTIYTDITQRARAERALRDSEARFRSLTALSSDWYWEQDTEFRFVRLEGRHVSGDSSAFENELGKTYWELGFEIEGGWEARRARLAAHEPFSDLVIQRRYPDGQQRFLRISGEPYLDAQGRFAGYRGVGRDVTPQKIAEERIQYLATHDGLTELPNRVLFSQLLNNKIHNARRYRSTFAVMFIDLDRFKLVNDTLGHEAGDELLKEMASRFSACLRASDVVARLGGDEFVVLVQEVGDREQVTTVARKLLSAAIRPVPIKGQDCRVSASIGVSLFPQDAEDEASLMKRADAAMYRAKAQGKNGFHFYSKEAEAQSLERVSFETSLRLALQRGEFSLHYQAKLDLKSGAISGVEALLRWQHPELGTVPPMEFIPLAEETGLILTIGRWVLKTACAQNVEWQRQGLPAVCVSVNISARQFTDELPGDIAEVLAATGMEPSLLELELTEGTVMANAERAVRLLGAIKRMGVRLAIDDFGTGYSSLAQIKRFPIDTLKVDRSFIREIGSGSQEASITQAIIAMGKTLSLTVVAGGVETEEQQTYLSAQACDEIQGYHFSKPVHAEQFAELLRRHVPAPRTADDQ